MLKNKIAVLAILIAGLGVNCAFAQGGQKKSAENGSIVTYEMLVSQYNFPVKKNTGNPEKDQAEYKAAKNRWISDNQALYRRYNEQGSKPEMRGRNLTQTVSNPLN